MKKYFLLLLAIPFVLVVSIRDNIKSSIPTVMLIDNSGSMGCSNVNNKGNCIPIKGQSYRIDDVKIAVRNRINQSELAATKVGLVEIGNYRGYKLKYDRRCEAVRTLVLPNIDARDRLLESLEKISPNSDGVTPIAFGLNSIHTDILKKQNLFPSRILLFSDGEPNCEKEYKYNLCFLVDGLAANNVDLQLVIVGYKATGKDSQFIECAKKHPEMVTYLGSANTLEGLQDKVDLALPVKPKYDLLIITTGVIIPVILFMYWGESKSKKRKRYLAIDLVFSGRINWRLFDSTLHNLKTKYGNENILVRTIEKQDDEIFVIQLGNSSTVSRDDSDKYFKQLDFYYQQAKAEQKKNVELIGVIKIMAEKDNSRTINIHDGNYVESAGTYVQGNYSNMSQDLNQAAAQILALLDQLQNHGVTVDVAKQNVAEDIANQAQKDPTVKEKLLKWGQSLGDATVNDVIKDVVKLAIRSIGIPLP
jgi:hypothetical protein